MTIDPRLIAQVEALRIPLHSTGFAQLDWKEWYHYVLIDPDSQIRVLVNFTLAGRAALGEIHTTLVATLPADRDPTGRSEPGTFASFGSARTAEWERHSVHQRGRVALQTEDAQIEIDGPDCHVELHDSRAQLAVEFRAQVDAAPMLVTESSPFGPGFIGWGLIPRLAASGRLSVCGGTFAITRQWFCYHDHNFGRFFWGSDIGWEWAVITMRASEPELTVILDRRTNRQHSAGGPAYLFVYWGADLRKVFLGPAVHLGWTWPATSEVPARLPGAMASFFEHRSTTVPGGLGIAAADEIDSLSVELVFQSALELVVPDNQRRSYTLMKELTGRAQMRASLSGEILESAGQVYAEFVH